MRFFDVVVTFTADQFRGIYRGNQYHEPDFGEVLKRAKDYGCEKVMLTTMSLDGAKQNLDLVRQFPEISLREYGKSLIAESPSPLAVFGEIGLDYVYLDCADKEMQLRVFKEQLDMATQFQLPLFLHVRESTDDFISIIKPYLSKLPRGGLVHSFAGSKAEMLRLVELGLAISVNGVSFRTEEQIEMVKGIPLERLQLETDAPWCEVLGNDPGIEPFLATARPLPPSCKHNKCVLGQMVKTRNESCTIERVGLMVAGLKGVTTEEVAEAAWKNSCRMFW
ncbi:TatD family [Penicillium argentinense]|uniref:TatD family n=1 Tax=Penicillium argentinense TaxID=1131581 RepID=A0A9W9KLK1_9EURO|nr:TatD family [Penicillium argentinense]KAJ5109903.1 TatD family [Penicillium argentinense]